MVLRQRDLFEMQAEDCRDRAVEPERRPRRYDLPGARYELQEVEEDLAGAVADEDVSRIRTGVRLRDCLAQASRVAVGVAVQAGEGLAHRRLGLWQRPEGEFVRGQLHVPVWASVGADVLRRRLQGHAGRFVGAQRLQLFSEVQAISFS